ncbi:MAG TPA: DUF58 domain-containing protein [Dongiaceae bacterium]|nr:DUF58 domain-containing protein [Dongiaceae bacterium]
MAATLQLNPRVLATVEDLSLVAQTIVEGFLDGLHRSPFLGYSTEFSTYRPYTQGDNPRHIDWKVWGRSDKLYVKQFEEYTNLRGEIFLDTSASMDFGTGEANKFDYGRVLAAALAYLMVRQNDAAGLVLFNEKSVRAVPARAHRHNADDIFQALSKATAGGATAIDSSLLGQVQELDRRGLAIVISDFFAPEETAFDLLRALQIQRQETVAFQILAPEEIELGYAGEVLFEDAESGLQLPVMAEAARTDYRDRLESFCGRLRQECVRLEVDYQRLRTDQPLDYALVSYLEHRAALAA